MNRCSVFIREQDSLPYSVSPDIGSLALSFSLWNTHPSINTMMFARDSETGIKIRWEKQYRRDWTVPQTLGNMLIYGAVPYSFFLLTSSLTQRKPWKTHQKCMYHSRHKNNTWQLWKYEHQSFFGVCFYHAVKMRLSKQMRGRVCVHYTPRPQKATT